MKAKRITIGCLVLAWMLTPAEKGFAQKTASYQDSLSSITLEPAVSVQAEPISIDAVDVSSLRRLSDVQLETFLKALDATPQLSVDALPHKGMGGTFYSLQHPEWPPLPGDFNGSPVWQMNGFYLLNDLSFDYQAQDKSRSMMRASGGGSFSPNGNEPDSPDSNTPPDISNYLKYMAQSFAVIDTNNAAIDDTNLYNALLTFADDNGTNPILQILSYQNDSLIFKASHFDYSGETTRDFALVICDTVNCPLYKNIDLSNPTNNIQNTGWLVQGTVPNPQVADPMYFVVSGISRSYNAFFRGIPYGGPQVELSGPQPNDIVSNTITFHAAITDLSGITNEPFSITVDGFKARYSIGASNSISLETKYNPNGTVTIFGNAANKARIYDPTNPPDNAKLFFSGTGTLPLDFENDTYMAFASDTASPNIGTNYFLFVIDKAQDIEATISDPANGQTVAHYAGHVPFPATISIPWNFTEGDHVTPYSNDTYAVTFIAYDPTELTITNTIDRHGVRAAARNILAYEEEDPSSGGQPAPAFLNSEANIWVGGLAEGVYEALYDNDFFSPTLYYTTDIGTNRDNTSSSAWPAVLTHGSESAWATKVLLSLTNANYSDFSYYMGHGNGVELGGGTAGSTFVNSYMPSLVIKQYVNTPETAPNHRMRKVAIWSCYSDSPDLTSPPGSDVSWADAFGIRPTAMQNSNWMMKNVGLFFGGGLPQGPYSGTLGGTSVEVATDFDFLWVAGPNPFPGGCDPTYAFSWAVSQIRGMSPELDDYKSYPAIIGFSYLNFAGLYDGELMINDITHVKR